jgi:predicted glycogen debranching enzyme
MPGLLLVPRRFAEARSVLESLASTLHRGLIASEFPEDGSSPLYLSADASLWWINAAYLYWRYSADHAAAQNLFETIVQIIRAYQGGTWLGINVDREGLVCSKAVGMGTTWMNAKVGDWIITPRPGRPIELTALWYNALRIGAEMAERFVGGDLPRELNSSADVVRESFNARFWNADAGCCFDVLMDNGPDGSIRPNQLLTISLPHAVLAPERGALTLDTVRRHLLTSMGVRTLSPDDPSYRGRYAGDVVSRDRAYHQGSAYPWLLGPYVTALLRTHGRDEFTLRQAREALSGVINYMRGSGLGGICELFDGDVPHKPGGAVACARSVAEVLRCYAEDLLDIAPPKLPDHQKTPQFTSK